jgi:ELWxxDGT repeat protein
MLFVADDGVHGFELWRTDGTAAGTTIVADIFPGEVSSSAYPLIRLDDRVLFWADDGVQGLELWRTDGTAAGTALALDLTPGPGAPQFAPRDVAVAGGRLHFSSPFPDLGHELISTDGTWEGTQVFDLVPGPGSSTPRDPAPARDRLYFSADDLVHGRELWVVDLALLRDGFESGDLTAWTVVVPQRSR